MFDDGEGEQPGQVEEEGSDNDNKSNEAEDEDDEPQNEEDEKNEEDDRKEEEEEEEEEEKKTRLLANYSEKLQKALMGDLNSDFPDNVKIVRIFTSSTFTGKYIT